MRSFNTLQPGETLGAMKLCVQKSDLDAWNSIYGTVSLRDCGVPRGLVTSLMMRAYCSIVDQRPPGNINVAQRMRVNRVPQLDEPLEAAIICSTKRQGKTRNIVEFLANLRVSASGEAIAEGALTMFWAT